MSEMNLDRPDARSSYASGSGTSANKAHDAFAVSQGFKRRYTLWCAIAPTVIFIGAFSLLCSKECSVLPWMTFIYAPVIALIVVLVVAATIWLRAGELPHEERWSVRWYIVASIFWGPLAAYAGFSAALAIIQFFGAIVR